MTTRQEKRPKTRSWDAYVEERLARDPKEALHYLNAALDEEPEVFLIALRHVINAQKRRIGDVAVASGVHRVSLHKALSRGGNPRLKTLLRVLDVMNIRMRFASKPKRRRKSA